MNLFTFSNTIKIFPMIALLFVAVLSGCNQDKDPGVRPTVLSTGPATDATSVALNTSISAVFSVNMDATASSKLSVSHGTTNVMGTSVQTGATISFQPSSDLLPNTLYTATINKNAANEAGTSMAADYTWNFTTGDAPDNLKPLVTLTTPLSNAIGIALNQNVLVTFSEVMDPSTITASSLTLKQGTNIVAGTVSYTDKTAKFTPSDLLTAGLLYTASITTAAKDIAGNALVANTQWNFTTSNNAATQGVVNLGQAGNYVILAKTAINNSSTSAITGDLGLSPAATSYITGLALTDFTGYATSAQVTGQLFAADMASPTPVNLTTAVENMITAYNDAAGRPSPDFLELATGNIGGRTLSPGLYKWTTTVSLPSNVVISGGSNDIWIFQISGDLSLSAAVNITLAGGAQAKNIFWQVAGQATLGTTSHFEGIILSMTGITFQTGASINGRALAQTAVILDSNTVTKPN